MFTHQRFVPVIAHLPSALLAAGLVLAWGGVAFGSFQYDDFANVLNDPATTQFAELVERLFGGIRPLTRLTYALCWQVFGDWAGGWLLAQWLVHAVVVVGVARLAELRTGDRTTALIAGACFAFLPSSAAAIAYVSGRSIGLSAMLLVWAMVCHERSVRGGGRAHHRVAMVLFLFACAARETALIFPALLFLWELFRPAASVRQAASRSMPYLTASALLAALALLLIPRYRELLQFSLEWRSPLESVAHNLAALPVTLSLALRPWALSVEHEEPVEWMRVAGALVLMAMVCAALRIRKRQPFVALALLWPIVALLPTHSFVGKLDAVTEGPLYLAVVGPAIACGHCLSRWLQDKPRVLSPALPAFALIAVGLCAWRTVVWGDAVKLWSEATARAPTSVRAWTNLGVAHFAAGHYALARHAFQQSLDLDPINVRVMLNLEVLAALQSEESEEP